MWKESSIKVNGEVFHYWMKQYDKGSEWGIDGGRISNNMNPVRTMKFDRHNRISQGHKITVRYSFFLTV